ncbi:beta transducin-like protein [Fusarium bulbicola]|nr:beta transducin-like protein [Fusarium bulbicola]
MPLLYGEGSKSFLRLQEEIVKSHDDLSLFAWKQDSASYGIGILRGCFADSPAEFAHWLKIQISVKNFESGMEVTSKNVKMDGRVLRKEDHPAGTAHGVECIFDLGVRDPDDENYSLGILLAGSSRSLTHFRFKPYELIKLPPREALLCRDGFDSDAEFDAICWEQEEAREESERKTIFIRKSISVQETRMMGRLQKPLFKIHWHEDVLKVLKSINGQTTKEYIPSFECQCHPDSAFHQDGTLTWVTDFELQINPQHVVSFVLATGLQWAPDDLRATCLKPAGLHYPHFWAVLFGEGRAYAIIKYEPISKQLAFKSGATSIETVPADRPTAKEQQSEDSSIAQENYAATSNATENDVCNRKRQFETWLGKPYKSILLLRNITE